VTPRSLLAQAPELLTESQWASVVNDTAKLGGWRRYHTYLSRRSPAGFPDLVLVRGPRLIFAELKTDVKTSRLTEDQEGWLEALREVEQALKIAGVGTWRCAARVEVYVWRPSDFDDVSEILTGKRPREERAA
jgi:hypothetical protein